MTNPPVTYQVTLADLVLFADAADGVEIYAPDDGTTLENATNGNA